MIQICEKQLIKTLKLRSRIQTCSHNKHHTHQINKYRLVLKGPNLKTLKTNLQILNTHTNQKRNNWCVQEKTSKEFDTRDHLNQRIELRHFFSAWFLKWITCFAQIMQTVNTKVPQLSKCLKFMTFREGCFVIRNWMQVLKWSSWDFLSPLILQKMKKDNISQLGDYDMRSVNNNTRMGLVISLCSNSNHLIS